jgi:hypothetical protein
MKKSKKSPLKKKFPQILLHGIRKVAEKPSWDPTNSEQKHGLVWKMKISQIIND